MIPTETQATALWDKYDLPQQKRLHVRLVATVAVYLAEKLRSRNYELRVDVLRAAALLHDIDKNVPWFPGEKHPDAAVRILREEGMEEIARLVKTHPLHAILDPAIAPKTIEEKLLFLADKMVKYEILSVDERFALWRAENLPAEAVVILDTAYPTVKELEKEILTRTGLSLEQVAKLASG